MTFEQLTAKYTTLLTDAEDRDGIWRVTTTPDKLRTLLAAMRQTFDFPEDLTCVDEGETLRVHYRLYGIASKQVVHVYVRIPHSGGHLPTACDLWRGFEWSEREAYDLFGVIFDGHPDLRRILTWEGFQGHPLLKDFQVDNDDTSWQIPEQTDQEIIDMLQCG